MKLQCRTDHSLEQLLLAPATSVASLLKEIKPSKSDYRLTRDQSLEELSFAHTCALLTSGMLLLKMESNPIILYEAGDMIPLDFIRGSSIFSIESDFAVELSLYENGLLTRALLGRPEYFERWITYKNIWSVFWASLFAETRKGSPNVQPDIQSFSSGDIIIHQDDEAEQVYTLLSGKLAVEVDGVQVGEVVAGQIFGALAALTDTKRTASVIAKSDVMVASAPKDQFVVLMKHDPTAVMRLVLDLSSVVVNLNQKVVSSETKQAIF